MTVTANERGAGVEVTHDLLKIGDHEVMVHRAGAGNDSAIVFLHGGGPGATGWSNWQFALPALGERYDCLAPDYIGFGESAHPDPAPTDMRTWTRMRLQQVIGMLDELGIQRASLVGNSLGGALSLHLLVEQPERFERAVLMGTAGGPSSHAPTQEVIRMVTFYADPSPEALARLYSWFIYDPKKFDGDLAAIAQDRYALTMRPEVRRSYEAQFSGPSFLTLPDSAIKRIEHPVLLVHGRDDAVNPVEDSYHFLRLLPNAELFVFPRCGHWTQIEYPEKFHRLLDGFFKGEL
jgi:2-hydroxymuconate-semialdehyde hydrolase